MSIFEARHDNALLGSPWLAKKTNDGQWLFKYAPHPDREGYVFIATNLELVLFESLTAPSIPSRLASLGSTKNRDTSSQKNEEDVLQQAEYTLKRLGEILHPGKSWEVSTVEIREHSFYDRLIRLTTTGNEPFEWIFNTAELRGPIPLSFVNRHLLAPLISVVLDEGQSRTAIESLCSILASKDLSSKLHHAAQTASALPTRKPVRNIPEADEKDDGDDESMSQNPLPATQRSPPVESVPTRQSLSPVKEEQADDAEEEYRSSPTHTPDTASPTLAPSPTQTDGPTPIPRPNRHVPSPRRKANSRSVSPVKPTPSAPSQLSQKSKREREKEEEEEMEKRREEMRRRMHTGGGGRLGRRRAGR